MKLSPEDYFIFSGGEVHCKIPNSLKTNENIQITCLDYTMNGFMALCEFKEALNRTGIKVHLRYPYFPYARQDRVIQANEPFSLKVFCELLNSRKFETVLIWDAHSDVVGALVENCTVITQHTLAQIVIPNALLDDPEMIWVSPDAGAYKKISKLISDDSRIAIGCKKRNSYGEITATSVYSPVDLQGKNCFIVDDICDGGRTFIELAKALKERGAAKVHLYITHGIFSKGFEEVLQHIDQIYTTDSFNTPISETLKEKLIRKELI